MKYIHLDCLKKWIKSKLTYDEKENVTSIIWKNFECELCSAIFPSKSNKKDYINHEQNRYCTIDYHKPENNYIILEILNKENNKKGFHILRFHDKSYITLGRGLHCDMRIPEISVSRMHAMIKMKNGEFFIQDLGSKYGTLVLIQKDFKLSKD